MLESHSRMKGVPATPSRIADPSGGWESGDGGKSNDKSDDAASERSSCPQELRVIKKNLNFAYQRDLMAVPQIGCVLSQRNVESAPYASWDEVQALKQVGPKRVDYLKTMFYI